MPLANRETAVDALLHDRAPDESPGVNLGILFGRTFSLFGSLYSAPSASSSGSFEKIVTLGVKDELLTIAAAATSDTVSATMLPANSLILAVLACVTVAIPTAATFTVGDATTPARFSTGLTVATGAKTPGITQWSGAITTLAAGPSQAANAAIRITPSATPATNVGRVHLYVAYIALATPSG
jgi:hypothetical protein